MERNEPTMFEAIGRWYAVIKKIYKMVNKNRIPNDYEGMKRMIADMEAKEQRRNEMNKMREKLKKMIRDKKQRQRWIKLERRRKIRKFLHLPYKTLNEDDFFKDIEDEENF